MWGNYSDGHKGVCLEYEFDENDVRTDFPEDSSGLINKIFSVNDQEKEWVRVQRNFFVDMQFSYLASAARIWLTGFNGTESSIKYDVEEEQKYNDLFEQIYTQKMAEWNYEGERRLLFKSKDTNSAAPIIKFDKKCLRSVIFGMSTSQDDMAAIESLVEDVGYPDVEFRKAYFDDNSKTIRDCWGSDFHKKIKSVIIANYRIPYTTRRQYVSYQK